MSKSSNCDLQDENGFKPDSLGPKIKTFTSRLEIIYPRIKDIQVEK